MTTDYKGCAIVVDAFRSGLSGTYRASFSVSRERSGNLELEYQGYLDQDFSSDNEADEAAHAAARAWIDQQPQP